MSKIKKYRNDIKKNISRQLVLQESLNIDQNDSNEIIKSLDSGELIVSVAGEINRGKSTFLNALMGCKIFPSRATICTAGVTILDNGEKPSAEVIFTNGKKEAIDLSNGEPAKILADHISRTNQNVKNINSLNIKFPNPFSGNGILLVDTPGVNDPENWREEITFNYLTASDAVIMLLDPVQPLSGSEVEFLKNKILDSCIEKLIFVVNKIDDIPMEKRADVLDRIEEGLSKHVSNPDIYALSSKTALTAKMNRDDGLFLSSGFKRFEEELLKFLMKGKGGALLETKINRGIAVVDNIDKNINSRVGALDSEKNIVIENLTKGKKDLSDLSIKKKEVLRNIKNEEKNIASDLSEVIDERRRYFNTVLKEVIINEPQLSSLRVNVLNFQKETVTLFKETIDKANKGLIKKYGAETFEIMSSINKVISSLNLQAVSSAKLIKVNKIQGSDKVINDKSDLQTGAGIGAAIGGLGGAVTGYTGLISVTSAGVVGLAGVAGAAILGAVTGGLGLLAGAGIAAYMKNKKAEETKSHYIETSSIVDNSKACDAVENFLKGMSKQSKVVSGMVITAFIERGIEPIERQISDQENLIKNINNDLNKTDKDQEAIRDELKKFKNESDAIIKDYTSLKSEIQTL